MKHFSKKLTLSVISSIVLLVLVGALALGVFAADDTATGSNPGEITLSADNFSVIYKDGVAEVKVNADALADILENRELSKETALSFVPELLVSLVQERDPAILKAFLKDAMAAPELYDFIPKEVLDDYLNDDFYLSLVTDEIIEEAVDFEKLKELIDPEEVFDSLSDEEREEVFNSLSDEEKAEFINPDQVDYAKIDVKLLKPYVDTDVVMQAVDMDKVMEAIDPAVLSQNVRALVMDLFFNEVDTIELNGYTVYSDCQLSLAQLEYAILRTMPDALDRMVAAVQPGADGVFAEFSLKAKLRGEPVGLTLKFSLEGDATRLASRVERVLDNVAVVVDPDNTVTVDLYVPTHVAKVFVRAMDASKIPADLKDLYYELYAADVDNVFELIDRISINDMQRLLDAVDGEKLEALDKKLEGTKIDPDSYVDAADKLLNSEKFADYFEKAQNLLDRLQARLPSPLLSKPIHDLYAGDGVFEFHCDLSTDLFALAQKVTDRVDVLESFLTDTVVNVTLNLRLHVTDFYKASFVADGEVLYKTYLPVGTPLSTLNGVSALAGHQVWVDENGSVLEEMPEGDTVFFAGEANQVVFMADGQIIAVVPYNFGDTSVKAPAVPAKKNYDVVGWEAYSLLKGGNVIVNAVYTPKVFTVTFQDFFGSTVAKFNYTVENYASIVAPAVPERDHYENSRWNDYNLKNGGNVVVTPSYTASVYEMTLYVNGQAHTVYYTIEDDLTTIRLPEVPAPEDHYKAVWVEVVSQTFSLRSSGPVTEGLDLSQGLDRTYELKYVPIEYTVTFVDENGVQVGTTTCTIEDMDIEYPEMPEKAHYVGTWEKLTAANIDNAVLRHSYTPVTYSLVFCDVEGKTLATIPYTIQNSLADIREALAELGLSNPPAREHYENGVWANVYLGYEKAQLIKPVYTPVVYEVVFYSDENKSVIVAVASFTVESTWIDVPTHPLYDHKVAVWKVLNAETGEYEAWDLDAMLANGGNVEVFRVLENKYYELTFNGVDENGAPITVKVPYTVDTDMSMLEGLPTPAPKEHYTAAWPTIDFTLGGDRTIEAVYTPVTYTITFVDEAGNVVETLTYTVEDFPEAPAVPEKEHCTGAWEAFEVLFDNTQTVAPTYTPVVYKIPVWGNGVLVGYAEYTVQNGLITDLSTFTVPAKEHFDGAWPTNPDLTAGKIEAVYTPCIYKITFVDAAGNEYVVEYSYGETLVAPSQKPANEHYESAVWPVFQPAYTEDQVVKAVYSQPKSYELTIVDAKGNTIAVIPYTVETTVVVLPDNAVTKVYDVVLPTIDFAKGGAQTVTATTTAKTFSIYANGEKVDYTVESNFADLLLPAPVSDRAHYTAAWKEVDLTVGGDIYLTEKVYTPTVYTITFVDENGNTIGTVQYDITSSEIEAPVDVPVKEHYNVAWPTVDPTLGGNRTVKAVYTPKSYTLTFVADGVTVGTVTYNVTMAGVAAPEVPAKEGYTGAWAAMDLATGGDKTVEAVYTELPVAELPPVSEVEKKTPWYVILLWILLILLVVGIAVVVVIMILRKRKQNDPEPEPEDEPEEEAEPEVEVVPEPEVEAEPEAEPVVIPVEDLEEETEEDEQIEEEIAQHDEEPQIRTEGKKSFINVSALQLHFEEGEEVTLEALKAKGLIPARVMRLKVIGYEGLHKSLTVYAHGFSANAKSAIEALGGKVNILH